MMRALVDQMYFSTPEANISDVEIKSTKSTQPSRYYNYDSHVHENEHLMQPLIGDAQILTSDISMPERL